MRECSDEWIKLKRKFKTAAAGGTSCGGSFGVSYRGNHGEEFNFV